MKSASVVTVEAPGSFDRVLLVLACVLVAMYGAVIIWVPFHFFADDSYFYFQVAWNFAAGHGSTFNQLVPTNGYHPLWMLVCALVYKLDGGDKILGLHLIGLVSVAMFAGACYWLCRLAMELSRNFWVVPLALLVPYLFLSFLGTEVALSAFCVSAMLWHLWKSSSDTSWKLMWLYGACCALAILSRLDNVFIVSFLWLAFWIDLGKDRSGVGRKRLLTVSALPVFFSGVYLATNKVFFHTWQPISGLLKSHSERPNHFGTNLPHTALLPLAIITVCVAINAVRQRDHFFRLIEVPMFLGILCHAAYIVFRMSTETRWSWYYVTWMILASLECVRVCALFLSDKLWARKTMGWATIVVLAAAWYKVSYRHYVRDTFPSPWIEFQQEILDKEHAKVVLAFDKPGALAYYTDAQIIALDGLMGDIGFQRELGDKGIQEVLDHYRVDVFLGPPVGDFDSFCSRKYLAVTVFHCATMLDGTTMLESTDVFARYPAKMAGTIPLGPSRLMWNDPHQISVWRIDHSATQP